MAKAKRIFTCIVLFLCVSLFSVSVYAAQISISASQAGKTSVFLSWNYDEPFDYFELYRSLDGASWKKVKDVFECSAYNYSLEEGVCYYYMVRPSYAGEFGDYSDTVAFTLPKSSVDAPTNLSVTQSGTNKVRLTWNAVEGADSYVLYRSEDGVQWNRIKSVAETTTENYNLSPNQTYYYKIKAVSGENYSNDSNVVSIQLISAQKAPENLRVERATANSVYLSWDAVEGAGSYVLYRSEDQSNWKKIKSVSGTSTYNYNLSEKTYYYKVCANAENAPFSDIVSIRISAWAAPGNLQAEQVTASSVSLHWDAVEGASSYLLYRSEDRISWTKIKSIAGTSTYNYNLSGKTYYYKVCVNAEYASFSDVVSIRVATWSAPENLQAEQVSASSVHLTWDAVEGASSYLLYRSEDRISWTKIKSIAGTSTYNYNLSGKTYYYKVCVNAEYASFSDVVSIRVATWSAPENLQAEQVSASSVHLTWDAVEGAESYILYRSENQKTWSRIKAVSGTSTYNYNLSGKTYYYKVCVNAEYAAFSAIAEVSVCALTAPSDVTATVTDNKVFLQWQEVEGADGYSLYRSVDGGKFSKVKSVVGNSTYNYNLESGKTYKYYLVAYKSLTNTTLYSQKSETICVEMADKTVYRALLIGETGYVEPLEGPDNDIAAMRDILTRSGYEVYSQLDATKSDIISLIGAAFYDATDNDVSLFYFSGHGVMDSGEYYSGALMAVDYDCIPTEELAELLSAIPGKVIVILDSCGSGAAISDGTDTQSKAAARDFSPQQFNSGVISAFSRFNRITTYSSELRQSKFSVLTGSAYEQSSLSAYRDGIWGGLLTRGISESVGRAFGGGWYGTYPADTDGNNLIAMSELYAFCQSYAAGAQDVQCYVGYENATVFLFD